MARSGSRKRKSSNWHTRQNRDPYVRNAQRRNLRSRAYFKLEEIDEKYNLFAPGQRVLDLGASPGSWSQFVASRIAPNGVIFAVDLLEMAPIDKVHFIKCDITSEDGMAKVREQVDQLSVNLVISDMAPNLSGIRAVDLANFERLHGAMFDVCRHALARGGSLVFKVFSDSDSLGLKRLCREMFSSCDFFKPKSSRAQSREFYLIAIGYGDSQTPRLEK